MYKVIGGDHKEYGPVSLEDLRRWIAEGRLNAQSLVQPEAKSEWIALANLPEFADALAAKAAAALVPGLPTLGAPGQISADQILARPITLDIGACLSRAWALLKSNFGLLLGSCFLVWFIGLVCQFIPLIGGLAYPLLAGVLYGGLCLVVLKRIRGQPASAGEVFAGFSSAFPQLMLAGFLTAFLSSLATFCCLIVPGIYLAIAWSFSVPLVADQRLEFWSAMELSRKVVTRAWFHVLGLTILAFLPTIAAALFVYVKLISMILPDMLGIMSSGQPDVTRMFGLVSKVALASLPLTALVKVVALINMPFAVGALLYAYEDLFGPRPAPNP